jgi:hypothetical protein
MTIEVHFRPDFLFCHAVAATPRAFGTSGLSGVSAFATLAAALDSVACQSNGAAAAHQRDTHHA